MGNQPGSRPVVRPMVFAVVVIVVLLFLGYLGWRNLGSGAGTERVPIDINKIRASFKQNGIGHK